MKKKIVIVFDDGINRRVRPAGLSPKQARQLLTLLQGVTIPPSVWAQSVMGKG